MVKKTISLLLVFAMILSIGMPSNVYGEVKDYSGHWAEDTIQLWLDKGYIAGYPDGSFKPEGLVTRAEFVKMVNSLFDYTEIADISFIDVKSDEWYYQEVQKAVKAGYISGVSETQFAPKDNLTREQAAAIISRIMKLESNSANTEVFSDSDKISSWAKESVGAAAKAEFIKGYEDNTFRPQNSIKRAEAIIILNNAMNGTQSADLIIDQAGTVIENKTFKNIHITDKVGSGEVTLKNVTVTGELLVEGGGLNTIKIENSDINKLTANKADGKVRILIVGDTAVDATTIMTGATLEQEGLTGEGFGEVIIDEDADETQTLTVKANIGELTVNAKINVNVKTGTIESIIIEKTAEGASINLSDDATVLLVTIDVKVTFTGTGTIVSAEINASEVTFEKEPDKTEVAPGVKDPEIKPPATGGGGSTQPSTVAVNAINVTPTMALTAGGATGTIATSFSPTNATNQNVTWSSSSTIVATVVGGVVTPLAAGTAVITATTTDGGFTAICTVTITGSVSKADAVNLGTAGDFAILSKAGITNVPTSNITGNVGTSPITGAVIGLTSAEVHGMIYSVDAAGPAGRVTDPVSLGIAVSDMETAYTDAAGRAAGDTELGDGKIGGLTIAPGVYKWGTDVLISTNVTLSGGVNDVWIFQIAGKITQQSATSIILMGGAQAKNIFWQAAGTVAIGTTAHFEGIILGKTNITLNTGASINGRLLAQTAVTLISNTVVAPAVVSVVPVSAITVTGNNTVVNGQTLQLGATVLPDTATNKTVTWSVTNGTGSATILATGLLTGTGVGTVTVKATNVASGVTGTKVITITNPTATLEKATATGNFGNVANINEMMTALWAVEDSTVQGIAIKPVFSFAADKITVNGDNVTEGLLQWILTQWGGSSVPVAISFSNGTPEGLTTDANWDNSYTVWVDLGALVAGTETVGVSMTNGTATYTITTTTTATISLTGEDTINEYYENEYLVLTNNKVMGKLKYHVEDPTGMGFASYEHHFIDFRIDGLQTGAKITIIGLVQGVASTNSYTLTGNGMAFGWGVETKEVITITIDKDGIGTAFTPTKYILDFSGLTLGTEAEANIANIASVARVKGLVAGATYTMTQAAATDEAKVKTAIETKIETLVLNGVTPVVTKVLYTEALAGNAGTPNGTNGTYTFTVALSNGAATDTTETLTMTVAATAFTATTNNATANDVVTLGLVGTTVASGTSGVATAYNR